MIRYFFSRYIKRLLKIGLVIGTLITAYQASRKATTKKGGFDLMRFVASFRSQAAVNIRLLAGFVKTLIGKYFDLYRASGKGSARKKAAPANDTMNAVYDTIRTVAPDFAEQAEDYVEDVRENAPEYKAEAQDYVDKVTDAAIKTLGLEDVDVEPEEKKPAVEVKKTIEAKPAVEVKKAVEAKPAEEKKADKPKKPRKAVKEEKEDKDDKPKKPRKAKKDDKEEK